MVVVREATPADAASLFEVHTAAIRGLAGTHYDERELAAWSNVDGPACYPVGDDDQLLLVAESGGMVVGFGQLDLTAAEIGALYVHPDAARRGVGSTLLDHLETAAAARGESELLVPAALNAVGFYESTGYDVVERTTVKTGGVELAVVMMCKELPSRGAFRET